MLSGTASLPDLLLGAATMKSFDTEPAELAEVTLLKVFAEAPVAARTATLPAGLHPTNPPTVAFHVWSVGSSPWGPFRMIEARVGCRSGTRPRGFVAGCLVDGSRDVSEALRARWGFPARPGTISLEHGYDHVRATATVDGITVCLLDGRGAEPITSTDIAWTSTVTLAETPRGPRLVQVDVDHRPERAERVRGRIVSFTPSWTHPALAATEVVSASISSGAATLPRLRFVCRPDELAFGATEVV